MKGRVTCRIGRPVALGLGGALITIGLWAGPGDARILTRFDPEFPREALLAGATRGFVRARVTLCATGEVVRVRILEASPLRVFDRAVVKSLSLWRFDDGADGRLVQVDVQFAR